MHWLFSSLGPIPLKTHNCLSLRWEILQLSAMCVIHNTYFLYCHSGEGPDAFTFFSTVTVERVWMHSLSSVFQMSSQPPKSPRKHQVAHHNWVGWPLRRDWGSVDKEPILDSITSKMKIQESYRLVQRRWEMCWESEIINVHIRSFIHALTAPTVYGNNAAHGVLGKVVPSTPGFLLTFFHVL